jgi:hypothetical protein
MTTIWLKSAISDIALKINSSQTARFWDEDENGTPQKLEDEHILRYFRDFLPCVGIFDLPDEDSKGIPHLSLVFFYENRVEKINESQFEYLVKEVLSEVGYQKANKMIHFMKSSFFGSSVILSVQTLEDFRLLRKL